MYGFQLSMNTTAITTIILLVSTSYTYELDDVETSSIIVVMVVVFIES
jgi:hypothetical protein